MKWQFGNIEGDIGKNVILKVKLGIKQIEMLEGRVSKNPDGKCVKMLERLEGNKQ